MAAIAPYPKPSELESKTPTQMEIKPAPYPKLSELEPEPPTLMEIQNEIIQTLFPSEIEDDISLPKVATFFITTSSGNKTLILADALEFVKLRNSYDPLRELLPVIFDCCPRNCSEELIEAIRENGHEVKDSPKLVALQIGPYDRSSRFSYTENDPHRLLASIIKGIVQEGSINGYPIRKIPDTWNQSDGDSDWKGAAFEQEDRLIYTWIHPANDNAQQRAKDDAQLLINKTKKASARKKNEIQKNQARQRKLDKRRTDIESELQDLLDYLNPQQGAKDDVQQLVDKKNAELVKIHKQIQKSRSLQGRLDREYTDIADTLKEYQNQREYFETHTVNSATMTTLQCAITIQIDSIKKIRLLEKYVLQQIVSVIDRSLEEVSWQELQIKGVVIENFIRQKFSALEQKLPTLVEYNSKIKLTDWKQFYEVFPKRRDWACQTFQDFCLENVGRSVQDPQEDPTLCREWQESLGKKLKWITAELRRADDSLKVIEDFFFTIPDIKIFDNHRKKMVEVLRESGKKSYRLALELEKRYREKNLIRNAISDKACVHLVKRITSNGHVYFGVAKPPRNPTDRPDSNESLNEVHIPVIKVSNVAEAPAYDRPTRRTPSPFRHWTWVTTGALVLLGALIVGRYFKGRALSKNPSLKNLPSS